jgi:hypothetical protein
MEFPAGALPWQPPFTLGHESVLGPDATAVVIGVGGLGHLAPCASLRVALPLWNTACYVARIVPAMALGACRMHTYP